MWTIIIILVLALILLAKISFFFSKETPLNITSQETGLSSADLEKMNKFRLLVTENTFTQEASSFWSRVAQATTNFGRANIENNMYVAKDIADCLRGVTDKKRFGEVYRQKFNETIPSAIVCAVGESLYLQISDAVNGFGDFL